MAGMKIDSGDFPLMRNVDASRQPERANVYNAWIKAFSYNVPDAVDHLADIIEDVYTFELWKDKYLDTPEQFFDRIGILGLNLDEPAKLIKELRKKRSSVKHRIIERAAKAKELAAQDLTQVEIAERLGVDPRTIRRDADRKNVRTEKMSCNRKVVKYSITQYTKPETAALRIRETFGEDFALTLGTILTSG